MSRRNGIRSLVFFLMALGLLACTALETPTPTTVPPTTIATPIEDVWEVHFFQNTDAEGAIAHTEYIEAWNLEYRWGVAAPLEGMSADGFSLSAFREFVPSQEQAVIDILVFVDDGIRIWINGEKVLDEWFHQQRTYRIFRELIPGENNTIVFQYFEEIGTAFLESEVRFLPLPKPEASVIPDAWLVRYWQIEDDRRVYVRESYEAHTSLFIDNQEFPGLRRYWGDGGPEGLEPDKFEASYSRLVSVVGGTYRFTLRADDQARLLIDDIVVLDTAEGPQIDVTLAPGTHFYEVRYRENGGDAFIELNWVPTK